MKIAIDLQKALLVIFTLLSLSIGTAILVIGWTPTWAALQVPTLSPIFADMRTVQGAIQSDQLGFDPQVKNPGDLRGRVMNYPKIWLWIAKIFQLGNETNYLLFICAFVLAYLVSCFLILQKHPSLYVLLAIFSGASLLAVERGNNDLLAFVLIFAGISLSQDYFRAFSILLTTVLKIYPVFLVITLAKKPKIFIPLIVLVAGYFLYSFGELNIIQAGNTALTDPASIIATYGFDTIIQIIQHINPGQSDNTYTIIKYILIFISLFLIAFISQNHNLNSTSNSAYKTDLFISGGIIFSSTYLITSNWDYRLIFLLFCIPYILSIQNGIIKHSMLISIILSLNGFVLWKFLGQNALLPTISKYYVFLMVTACLVREFINYLPQIIGFYKKVSET